MYLLMIHKYECLCNLLTTKAYKKPTTFHQKILQNHKASFQCAHGAQRCSLLLLFFQPTSVSTPVSKCYESLLQSIFQSLHFSRNPSKSRNFLPIMTLTLFTFITWFVSHPVSQCCGSLLQPIGRSE